MKTIKQNNVIAMRVRAILEMLPLSEIALCNNDYFPIFVRMIKENTHRILTHYLAHSNFKSQLLVTVVNIIYNAFL